MTQNEMAILGDYSIGTVYPLTLKLSAALDKPRDVSQDGKATMQVGAWEIRVGETLLEDTVEQNIAFYLMMYGRWDYDGGRVEFDEGGLPITTVHTVSPEEITPNQGFEIIGSLSSIYSQIYNSLTLKGDRVSRLNVNNPMSLGPVIPRNLKKKQLPIWRFILQPNYQ
jgi:hypothetical protein